MIFRILKNLYDLPGDFALRSEFGDFVCKTAYLNSGYYIYNKNGIQLAQLVFDGNTALMSVASPKPVYPGVVRMTMVGKDQFVFDNNVIEKGDEEYLKNVQSKKALAFSIWGKPSEYGYDIYEGSSVIANVIPYPQDDSVYQVRAQGDGNILYILMICLAAERLRNVTKR